MERKYWISTMPWNRAAINKTTNLPGEAMMVMMHCSDPITNNQMRDIPGIWTSLTQEDWLKKLDGQRKVDESTTMEIFYLRMK